MYSITKITPNYKTCSFPYTHFYFVLILTESIICPLFLLEICLVIIWNGKIKSRLRSVIEFYVNRLGYWRCCQLVVIFWIFLWKLLLRGSCCQQELLKHISYLTAYKTHPQFSRAYSGKKMFKCISIFQHSSFMASYHYITKNCNTNQSTLCIPENIIKLIYTQYTNWQLSGFAQVTIDGAQPPNSPRCLLFEQLVYHKYCNSLQYFFSVQIVMM